MTIHDLGFGPLPATHLARRAARPARCASCRLVVLTALAGLWCSLLSGVAGAQQPAIQPVRPEDVPKEVREAHERRMREQAERATQPVAPRQTPAQAQPQAQPPAESAPIVRESPKVTSTDPDVLALVGLFSGHFTSADGTGVGSPQSVQLTLATAVINVDGLDNALYFELSRTDAPDKPFRQGVLHFYKRQGKAHVRQFEFGRVAQSFGGAVAGLWTAPEVFPKLSVSQLAVTLDMPVTRDGDGFAAATTQPVPSTLMGAVEVTSAWKGNPQQIMFVDRGFDATGKEVFGPGGGSTVFVRSDAKLRADKRPNGVVVIDFKNADAGARTLEPGNDAAVHYTGWLTTGEIFGTSRPSVMGQPGEDNPLRFTHGNMIPGFNDSILGVGRGSIRRIYVPAQLGYGPRARGRIPANSDLIFTVETLWVDHKVKPAESEAPQGVMTPATAPSPTPVPTPAPETKKPG